METLVCSIQGMHCAACAQKIEKALNESKGIKSSHINFATEEATIFYNPSEINEKKIFRIVEKLGYKFSHTKNRIEVTEKKRSINLFTLISVVLCTLLTLGFLISSYITSLTEISFYRYISIGVAIIVFVLGLISQIKIKKYYEIVLISIFFIIPGGLFINSFLSEETVSTVFYNTSNFFITYLLIIQLFEKTKIHESKEFFEKIKNLLPQKARLFQHETFTEIDPQKLKKGDIFLVKQGETMPADGIIIEGSSKINEGLITGKKDSIEKEPGEFVYAGTINKTGEIYVKALLVGENIVLKNVIDYNKKTLKNKLSARSLYKNIDKITKYLSIPLSIICFGILLLFSKNTEISYAGGISLLVLLNPLFHKLIYEIIFNTAVIENVKRGISIKSGKVFERLSKINSIILNKTGIITNGFAEIDNIIPKPGFNIKRFLILIGSLERASNHQFAEAIVDYCKENKITLMEVFDFKEIEGNGVMGKVDGQELIAGNFKLMEKSNVTLDKDLLHKAEVMSQNMKSPIFVAKNRELIGIVGVGDKLKPSTKSIITKLKNYPKMDISIITGDNKKIAEGIAKELRLHNVIADMRPRDKVEAITNQQGQGKNVAFVGDGINDAESLKKADIGISANAQLDYDLKTSDITLIDEDLLKIDTAIKISKKSTSKMNTNNWILLGGTISIILINVIFYLLQQNILPPFINISLYFLIIILIEFNNHSFKTFAYSIS